VCVGAFFHGAFKAAPVGAWTVVMAFSSLVKPSGSLLGYVKEAGGVRRSDGRAPGQPLRDRAER
jgi:hypothetical protein